MSLKIIAQQLFQQSFGTEPTRFFQAPGRVNLIGEHTDYNDGFVMPCAIDFQTVIAASSRDDDRVRVTSANFDKSISEFSLGSAIAPDEANPWSNYLRGVADTLQKRGYTLKGADIAIAGDVPTGAGLSSSASLEVVTGLALSKLSGLSISLKELAVVGQQAENEFVGMKCGIMDQFISALGHENCALLIDCRSLEYQQVSVPPDLAVMIINSKVKHQHVGGEYNTRRQQCEVAAKFFGVPALRDVSLETFHQRQQELDPLVAKRAYHVITENARTEAAAEALAAGDVVRMGELMRESHLSMRDNFEITVPEIDILADIANAAIGDRGGARMTGGGFGGCVVALVPSEQVDAVKTAVIEQYPAATGLQPSIYICRISAGAGEIQEC